MFSSDQPDGLMTRPMGQNMMRKDGAAHRSERRAVFPTVSPMTARDVWTECFRSHTRAVLDAAAPLWACDLVRDFAMPASAHPLRVMTGQLAMILSGHAKWPQAFVDYARWISPMGMSPRRIGKPDTLHSITLRPGTRAFLMFGSRNRDAAAFRGPAFRRR